VDQTDQLTVVLLFNRVLQLDMLLVLMQVVIDGHFKMTLHQPQQPLLQMHLWVLFKKEQMIRHQTQYMVEQPAMELFL